MISIIVPVYNVESFLSQCMDSLIHQTYQDIEIICVNDGSTDYSLDILQRYYEKDKRIKIISRDNRGISASRNEALDIASGDYILFVDSDDWIDEKTLEKALKAILEDDSDLVLWSYIREFQDRSLPNYLYRKKITWESGKLLCRRMIGPVNEELITPQKLDSYGTVWGKLYKRELIEQEIPIRFIDTTKIGTCEDILFNLEYSLRTNRSVYIPELLYHYRKNRTSFTSKYRENLPRQWKEQYLVMKDILKKYGVFEDYENAYLNRVSLGIVGLGLNITASSLPFFKQQELVKLILDSEHYKKAVRSLSLKYLPIYWKFFYFCAKKKFSFAVLCFLKIINWIIS